MGGGRSGGGVAHSSLQYGIWRDYVSEGTVVAKIGELSEEYHRREELCPGIMSTVFSVLICFQFIT